jgi:hypothetical protein
LVWITIRARRVGEGVLKWREAVPADLGGRKFNGALKLRPGRTAEDPFGTPEGAVLCSNVIPIMPAFAALTRRNLLSQQKAFVKQDIYWEIWYVIWIRWVLESRALKRRGW